MGLEKYGPRVIGDQAFKRQQEVKKKAASKYGPRVRGALDEEEEARLAKINRKAAPPAPKPDPDPEKDGAENKEGGDAGKTEVETGDVKDVPVAKLKVALSSNPNLVDEFLTAELEREEPRVTALEAMLKAEAARSGGPRDETTAKIEAAIEATREPVKE